VRHSVLYTILFSAALCVVCAIMVSGSAVGLKDMQEFNKTFDRKLKVLEAAGKIGTDQKLTTEEVDAFYAKAESVLVDLKTGEEVEGDTETFDQQKVKKNLATSYEAPKNRSRVKRMPDQVLVYKFYDEAGGLETVVLPIEGYGLWGTLYGYLALEADAQTVAGIVYYDHKETPGLGGEVDNARWKALWPGRKVYGSNGQPALAVIKGAAGSVADAPHKVDGLSGATITSQGVTNMLAFWLGDDAFGRYLEILRGDSVTMNSGSLG